MSLPARISEKSTVQLPMTPLIDIVFLLLIYFLLTTNFLASDSLPLDLPSAATATSRQSAAIIVSLDAAGQAHLEGSLVSDKELPSRLRDSLAKQKGRSVLIRSDRSVPLARVVTVLDIARACGAVEISLAADRTAAVR